MPTAKTKTPELIGDEHPITKWQINRIMSNCSYQEEIKAEWVQGVTGDNNRISLRSLNQAQAKKIIMAQEGSKLVNQPTENWAVFDKNNPKHKVILSLLYQVQWVKPSEKWGEVPDLDRLSNFLQSEKSPVKKKLKDMKPFEIEKLIKAFNGIIKSIYK